MKRKHLFWGGCLVFPGLAFGEIVRVMSVESAAELIVVREDGQTRRVKLQGVVAPEAGEPARAAKKRLADLVLARSVSLEFSDGENEVHLSIGGRQVDALALGLAPEPRSPVTATEVVVEETPAVVPAPQTRELPAPAVEATASPAATAPAPPTPAASAEASSVAQLDADKATKPAARPVIANRADGLYHRPDCPGYGRVPGRHRVEFGSPGAAEREGFRLAGNCPLP